MYVSVELEGEDLDCFRGRFLALVFAEQAKRQAALLNDAVLIYRLRSPPRDVEDLIDDAMNASPHQIPTSMLVQTFMKKFRDGMDCS